MTGPHDLDWQSCKSCLGDNKFAIEWDLASCVDRRCGIVAMRLGQPIRLGNETSTLFDWAGIVDRPLAVSTATGDGS
ncbi:MAG TPA: hypothetical protein DDX19_06600 [Rhodopirellula baltica]|nr:hypothetical protein [Rhodopirellula baltica]